MNNSSFTGSALHYGEVQYIEIDSCNFFNNVSLVGGVIGSYGMSIGSIKNSVFKNNSDILSLEGYVNPEWPPYAYTYLLDKNTIVNNETPISFENYLGPPIDGWQVPK